MNPLCSPCSKLIRIIYFISASFLFANISSAQTNPAPRLIPYTQDFGNNWFQSANLPAGFAVWTSSTSSTTNTSASSSSANGDDNSFDSATVVKTPGQTYGYSGLAAGGTQINNGEIYIQTNSGSTGTDQLVLAINTIGYSNVTVSFDVEMINPQPRLTGFAFQYRPGSSGPFVTIDTSYWHNSSDRLQNQIDNFVNLTLPAGADNQSVIQLRWATSRDVVPLTGSCGLGFDNIVISGTQINNPLYFRSAASGNWNSNSTWESSPDSITWSAATYYPNSGDKNIRICNTHVVTTAGIDNLVIDEIIIDSGATLINAYNTVMSINDGPGAVDLEIHGTFVDSSNYSVIWPSTSRWRMWPNASLVKTTNNSSTNWQLKYYNGISSIPSTSNWICCKPPGANVEPAISSTNGGPPYPQVYFGNLFIENNSTTWNPNNLCKFSGSANFPVIKGNLYIGGNGNKFVNFYDVNTNSNPVKVLGDVIIKSGSTLTITGTGLEVQGNFVCDGMYTYAASTSKLLFSGNNSQNVSGSGTISTYKLEINKTGGDVQANNVMNVFGNLNLLSGIIYTNSISKIIVNDNATSTNASDISYINGQIQKKGDDNFTFPVGKLNNYQPLSINTNSGAQITDAFTAEYFHVDPTTIYGNVLDPTLDHLSSCEYWMLTSESGTGQKNITLTWDANSCSVTSLPDLRVARYNLSMWLNEGNVGTTGNILAGTIVSDPVSDFGPFTLASTTAENPLPITLLSFSAKYNGKEVILDWVTATEINNQFFTVERSIDGMNFEKLFTMPGAGNSNQTLYYSGSDAEPLAGVSYYRLRETDIDGKSTLSAVVPIRTRPEKIRLISFESSKPNSVIQFDISIPSGGNGNAEISDMSGKKIWSSDFSFQSQFHHFIFNSGNLSEGIYYLRINCNDQVFVKKFVY